ncbi:MAG: MarR family transcriptional regulator [Pseudonocardia sp.]|jgi:DNA-binding MarR family transcriptional regulator|nr:MarR family transcriptional regulator [Pseudonocardia sp.]
MSHEDVLPALEEELATLWRRARISARDAARALHPQLDPTAYPVVVLLGRTSAMRMSELGAALFLDKSTVSRQVDAAVRAGLAERTVDPSDARARLVALTPAGRAKLTKLQADQRARWEDALAGWSREDIVQLTALLAKLSQAGIA